jgi:hypothetical protein
MFKLFKRRKDKPSVMYGLFQKMGSAVERQQRKAADYLNAKAKHFNQKQLLTGFICFTLLFGGAAAYIVWQAIHRPARTVHVKKISIPKNSILSESMVNKEGLLTKEEIKGIRSFRNYLDSLQRTEKGKAIYDSIAHHRRGLLDSLAFIEQIYHEQLKTSEDGNKK